MRLQKYLSACGVSSRRQAEQLIREGRVTVNEHTALLGENVEEGDAVCLDGVSVVPPRTFTYIMLNKPRGYVTTLKDAHAAHTVAELVEDAGVRLFPVGRLDQWSEGLLILTDDGDTANWLSHPSHGVEKTYRVWVGGADPAISAKLLRSPIVWQGVRYSPARVIVLQADESRAVLDVTIREGKKREIRNMCAAAGLSVARLKRLRQGRLVLGDLPTGKWRYLTEEEKAYLRDLD